MSNSTISPTVVLVHGAFAESASWNGVIDRLLAAGHTVTAVANPLRGLASDTAYLNALVATIPGPVVLAGHSYGGMVISGVTAPNAAALVYVAAFAPEIGETALELSNRFPGSTLGEALAPPVALPDGGSDLSIRLDTFHNQFAADVPTAEAARMAATQRPVNAAALNDGASSTAWRRLPAWFVYGEQDRNIPAAAHAFMAGRAGAQETSVLQDASHVVMISHPDAVAELIFQAIAAASEARTAAAAD